MRTVSFSFFMMTGSAVVGIYIVAPLMVSLRPLVGSLFLALALALAVVIVCAARVVSILRRTAPFVADSSGLLEMPLLSPAFPPHYEVIEERRLVIPSSRQLEALVESTGSFRTVSEVTVGELAQKSREWCRDNWRADSARPFITRRPPS